REAPGLMRGDQVERFAEPLDDVSSRDVGPRVLDDYAKAAHVVHEPETTVRPVLYALRESIEHSTPRLRCPARLRNASHRSGRRRRAVDEKIEIARFEPQGSHQERDLAAMMRRVDRRVLQQVAP